MQIREFSALADFSQRRATRGWPDGKPARRRTGPGRFRGTIKPGDAARDRCYLTGLVGSERPHEERNSRSSRHELEHSRSCRSLRGHGSHRLSVGADVTRNGSIRLPRADRLERRSVKNERQIVIDLRGGPEGRPRRAARSETRAHLHGVESSYLRRSFRWR